MVHSVADPGLRWGGAKVQNVKSGPYVWGQGGQRSCWVHILICERCKMFSHGPMSGAGGHGPRGPPWIRLSLSSVLRSKSRRSLITEIFMYMHINHNLVICIFSTYAEKIHLKNTRLIKMWIT